MIPALQATKCQLEFSCSSKVKISYLKELLQGYIHGPKSCIYKPSKEMSISDPKSDQKGVLRQKKVFPGKRVTLPAESTLVSVYMRKKLTPLPESRARFPTTTLLTHTVIMCCLDQVDTAGRAKVFIQRKVGLGRRVTLPSKQGVRARWVTPLAEPTFCCSDKWFVKFCKEMEMQEKLAHPG